VCATLSPTFVVESDHIIGREAATIAPPSRAKADPAVDQNQRGTPMPLLFKGRRKLVAIPLIALVAVTTVRAALKWNQHEMYLDKPE
jgi:hypothetical protein